MNFLFIGTTIKTIGELLLAYTVLKVHYRFWQEHKVDNEVFSEMKRERSIGMIGVALIVIGYLVHLLDFLL